MLLPSEQGHDGYSVLWDSGVINSTDWTNDTANNRYIKSFQPVLSEFLPTANAIKAAMLKFDKLYIMYTFQPGQSNQKTVTYPIFGLSSDNEGLFTPSHSLDAECNIAFSAGWASGLSNANLNIVLTGDKKETFKGYKWQVKLIVRD